MNTQWRIERWGINDFAEIVTKEGKATLDLCRDEKLPLPTTVEPLRDAILSVIPHAGLADAFIEVEDWVGFRDEFLHLDERQNTPTRDLRTDMAHSLNLPLTTIVESTDILSYELTHVSDWYLCEETIRRAITAVMDWWCIAFARAASHRCFRKLNAAAFPSS